ncbi:phosphoserine transaminase, partial [Salmonella enterica subsp. enterica serovar Poona]
EPASRPRLHSPANYTALFRHRGGRGQFARAPRNLLGDKTTADYVDAGYWAASAIKEAKKYCAPQIIDAKNTVDGKRAVKPMRDWQLYEYPAKILKYPNETNAG